MTISGSGPVAVSGMLTSVSSGVPSKLGTRPVQTVKATPPGGVTCADAARPDGHEAAARAWVGVARTPVLPRTTAPTAAQLQVRRRLLTLSDLPLRSAVAVRARSYARCEAGAAARRTEPGVPPSFLARSTRAGAVWPHTARRVKSARAGRVPRRVRPGSSREAA